MSCSDLSLKKDIHHYTVLGAAVPDFFASGYFCTVYYLFHFLSTVYHNCSILLLLLITVSNLKLNFIIDSSSYILEKHSTGRVRTICDFRHLWRS